MCLLLRFVLKANLFKAIAKIFGVMLAPPPPIFGSDPLLCLPDELIKGLNNLNSVRSDLSSFKPVIDSRVIGGFKNKGQYPQHMYHVCF